MPVMVTAPDLAEQMHVDVHRLYEWACREDDPMPLRTPVGGSRSSCMDVEEFRAWWQRNSRQFKEAKDGREKRGGAA